MIIRIPLLFQVPLITAVGNSFFGFFQRRKWDIATWLIFFLLCLAQSPGKISADTKLDLAINPQGFLRHAMHLWNSFMPLGQVQNQAYGYFFPQGCFYLLMQWTHLPVWIGQRLWWSLWLFVGFTGFNALAKLLHIGSSTSRIFGALCFTFAPHTLATLGAISSETVPYMLSPWIALGVVQALLPYSPPLWRLALGSSCAFLFCGAVNAVANIAALGFALLWLLAHKPDKRWRIFVSWWLGFIFLISLWWAIPLLLLAKLSPPFLDYIESSRVTTKWTSLTEVIRGTGDWSPYVSEIRQAGHIQVTNWVEVLATSCIAAIGLWGLCKCGMPHRKKLIVIFLCGLMIFTVGYAPDKSGFSLGSIFASPIRDFLDGSGKAFRNMHKIEALIRIPLSLGIIFALESLFSRIKDDSKLDLQHKDSHNFKLMLKSLPTKLLVGVLSQRPHPAWGGILGFFIALLLALAPVLQGNLATADSFARIPPYWKAAAQWLGKNAGTGRVLVVPGASAAHFLWGYTSDLPLQAYAESPWAIRDAIPLVPSEGIRWLDGIENELESGYDSPGLAQTLWEAGFQYVLLARDYDIYRGRTVSPFLAEQTLRHSPGFTPVINFGKIEHKVRTDKIVLSDGVDTRYYPNLAAITIFSIGHQLVSHSMNSITDNYALNRPHLIPVSQTLNADGSAESLALMHNFDSQHSGAYAPVIFNSESEVPGVFTGIHRNYLFPPGPEIVTDTPALRETDYGRVYDNHSAIRASHDLRRVPNSVTDYISLAPHTQGEWHGAQVQVSSAGSDATELGQVLTWTSPANMFDNSTETAWFSRNLTNAVGQWVDITLPQKHRIMGTIITAKTLGPQVDMIRVDTDTGTSFTQGITPGIATPIEFPPGYTQHIRITAADTVDHTRGNQFAISELHLSDAQTAEPLPIYFSVTLPRLDRDTMVSDWYLGQYSAGHAECVGIDSAGTVCSPELGLSSDTPGVFARTLSVPQQMSVTPTILVRSHDSTALDAILEPPGLHVVAPASTLDPLGGVTALMDDNRESAWTDKLSDSSSGNSIASNTITITLDRPQSIDKIQFISPAALSPAAIDQVAINTGLGRIVRSVHSGQWIQIPVHKTQLITITPLHWKSKISINDLGFASPLAPGFAEINLSTTQNRILPQINPDQIIDTGCQPGIILTLHRQKYHFRVRATRKQLAEHDLITAKACSAKAYDLFPGRENLKIDPGPSFSIIAVHLHNRKFFDQLGVGDQAGMQVQSSLWTDSQRIVPVASANEPRLLYIPESFNPGWKAILDGQTLPGITVNGWQQGWYINPGMAGKVDIQFVDDSTYRSAIFVGLPLAAILGAVWFVRWEFLAAILPRRLVLYGGKRHRAGRTWQLSGLAWCAICVICGLGLASYIGAILALLGIMFGWKFSAMKFGIKHSAEDQGGQKLAHRVNLWIARFVDIPPREAKLSLRRNTTKITFMVNWFFRHLPEISAGSFMISGIILARAPWRDEWNYNGFHPETQIFALISILALLISIIPQNSVHDDSNIS